MIDRNLVVDIIKDYLSDKDIELIDLTITSDNQILVDIDSYTGVDIDTCAALSNFIESKLDRDIEDYALQVGCVSLTAHFKTKMQYRKHLGHEVTVVTKEGLRMTGELVEVSDGDFSVDVMEMIKEEGAKRRHKQIVTRTFNYDDVKSVCYNLKV